MQSELLSVLPHFSLPKAKTNLFSNVHSGKMNHALPLALNVFPNNDLIRSAFAGRLNKEDTKPLKGLHFYLSR